MKSQTRHVGRGLRVADSGLDEPPASGLGGIGVAEARQDQPLPGRPEFAREMGTLLTALQDGFREGVA